MEIFESLLSKRLGNFFVLNVVKRVMGWFIHQKCDSSDILRIRFKAFEHFQYLNMMKNPSLILHVEKKAENMTMHWSLVAYNIL